MREYIDLCIWFSGKRKNCRFEQENIKVKDEGLKSLHGPEEMPFGKSFILSGESNYYAVAAGRDDTDFHLSCQKAAFFFYSIEKVLSLFYRTS